MTSNLTNTYVCQNTPVTLVANGASTYTWSDNSNGNSIQVTPAVSTVYVVMGSGSTNTCVATLSYSIFVESPNLAAGPSTAICMGGVTTLTAGAGSSYTWLPGGSGFQSLGNISPSVTTVYTVGAIVMGSVTSCPAYNTVTVTVNATPTINITSSATKSVVCKNDRIILTAGGASSFVWYNQSTASTVAFTGTINVLHTLTVTGIDANGCTGAGSIQFQVSPCNGLDETDPTALLRAYPNPAAGILTVESPSSMDVIIFSTLGQKVSEVHLDAGKNEVDLAVLPEGVYYLGTHREAKGVRVVLQK
jgi:hypothetical protein